MPASTKRSYSVVGILVVSMLFASLPSANSQVKDVETSGDILRMALPALAFSSTFIWHDDNKPMLRFIGAMATTQIVTYSLKHIIDKERPNGGRYSFPSGHTSWAFTGAATLDRRFGWKVGVPAYLLASYTGWTRVYANKHDYWDILGGATIGIGSAYLFNKKYKKHQPTLSFNKVGNTYLFGFKATL